MSEPYLGEIRMFAGNFAPQGWALCTGQLLSISQNDALFSLIGTTYGGDGMNTFGLPDLQGRVPVHQGSGNPLGMKAGTESVTLLTSQLPAHTHVPIASTAPGNAQSPGNAVWAAALNYSDGKDSGGNPIAPVAMNNQIVSAQGGSQPHDNMMPSLAISFIIALEGIYPSQQ